MNNPRRANTVFFPRENRTVRKTYLWSFLSFLTHKKSLSFKHTILRLFTGSPIVSRPHLGIFSCTDFLFSKTEIDIFENFSRVGFFFSSIKNKVKNFQIIEGDFQSGRFSKLCVQKWHNISCIFGIIIWGLRFTYTQKKFMYVIWGKFSRTEFGVSHPVL